MRRLALIGVLVPGLALAGWLDLPALTGTPQDVLVVDGGSVLATSSTAAGQVALWQVADGGYTTLISQAGNYVGAGVFASGCVAAALASNTINFIPAGCGTAVPHGLTTTQRFRVFASGLSVGRGLQTGLGAMIVAPSPTATYQGFSLGVAPTAPSLGTAHVGPMDVALLNFNGSSVWLSVDGGAPTSYALSGAARDAVPFERFARPAAVVLFSAGTVGVVPDLLTPGAALPVALPGGFVPQFVAFTTEGGSDAGAGYGLMSSASGQVLSPVPDPSSPGLTWLVRAAAPQLIGRVHCQDARACAGFADGGVVSFLSNDGVPMLSLDAGVITAGVPTTLTASASDPDGDPLFITWSGPATFVPGDPEGRSASVTLPASAECTTATLPLVLTISDGLAAHDRTVMATASVLGQSSAWIVPANVVVSAGDAPVSFLGGVDAGCTAGAFTWSSTDGQSGMGPSFSWTVPTTECNADGGSQAVSVTWLDQAGHRSTATSAITVQPWGLPLAPRFPMPAEQPAGTTRVWTAVDAEHACAQSAGYPGSALQWMLPVPPAGVTLTPVDGGLEIASTDFCTSATVTATAQRLVNGASPSQLSAAGTLNVSLVPNPPPLGATTPFSMNAEVDAGVASGFFTVDAGCRDPGLLAAEVTMRVPDSGVVVTSTGRLPIDAGWSLALPISCGAGTFDVVGELFDSNVATGAVDTRSVSAETKQALPGIVSTVTLPVVCGQGGRGQLRVESNPDGCVTPLATWQQVGGPALVNPQLTGAVVDVQTVSTGLDVVGGRLSFAVTVSDGSSAMATGTHEVLLTADPFVQISEILTPFPAREEESVLVTVRLHNATSCDVSGLELHEALSGLSPALDTLRLGDAAATGEWLDGTLVLRGVALAAGESRDVTFKARRRLLARGTATGTVLLADQAVSFREAEPTGVTGCGCEAGGAPLFAALALLAALRRRRVV